MDQRKKLSVIYGVIAGIGIVLILAAVLIFGQGHIYRTYENKAGGFKIKYPANWVMAENVGGAAVIFYSPVENDLDFFKENVNVVVQDISANPLDLKDYSELAIEQMEKVFKSNFVLMDSKPKMIAGQNGYQITFLGKGPEHDLKFVSSWTINSTTAYQVTYTSLVSQHEKYLPKAQKIINSFRIL